MHTYNTNIDIPESEVEFSAVRAQGPGGQNVNKVSSAIHLRFDIRNSSLPAYYKQKLLSLRDKRISKDGILIIKAQNYRNQEKNRADALERLYEIIDYAIKPRKKRIATKPGKSSRIKRMDSKTRRGRIKSLRRRIAAHEID